MSLFQNVQSLIDQEKQIFLENVSAFVQEHKEAYDRYIRSSAFEQDIDDWTRSFSTKYYVDQNYSSIENREDRIKLKLQQLTRKIKASTAEGGVRGAKVTIPSMNLKVILGGAATGALGQLLFSLRFGSTVLMKRFFSSQLKTMFGKKSLNRQ